MLIWMQRVNKRKGAQHMQKLRGVKGCGTRNVPQKVGLLGGDLQAVRRETVVTPN